MQPKFNYLRSDLEEQQLRRKIKELEKKNPNLDLSALFDSEVAEEARQALHKKAYASYKAYTFLKHGIKTGKEASEMDNKPKVEPLSKAKRRLRDNDPYNFPELNKSVASLLSKDVALPSLNDMGE